MSWHFDIHAHVQVSMAVALDILDTFAFQSEHGAGLSAGRDLDAGVAVQSGHFDFRPQRGLNEADGYFAQQIFTVPLKDLMRTNVNDDIEIPGWSAAEARLAISCRAQP